MTISAGRYAGPSQEETSHLHASKTTVWRGSVGVVVVVVVVSRKLRQFQLDRVAGKIYCYEWLALFNERHIFKTYN